MNLDGHKCPDCGEETFVLSFSSDEAAYWERQGCGFEFDRDELTGLLYGIQRALLGIEESESVGLTE